MPTTSALGGMRAGCGVAAARPAVAPQPLARVVQLLEARRQHVLGQNQAALRRENQPLGPDRADRGVALMAREQRHGRNELPQQRQHGADVDRQLVALDDDASTSARRQPGARSENSSSVSSPGDRGAACERKACGGPARAARRARRRRAAKSATSTNSGANDRISTGSPDSASKAEPARTKAVLEDRRRVDPGGRRHLSLRARGAPVAETPPGVCSFAWEANSSATMQPQFQLCRKV